MNDVELAWLAGLFEGEGSITIAGEGRFYLELQMTDEDVVRKAAAIAGLGRITDREGATEKHKHVWRWGVTATADAALLLEAMLPHLGARRSARAAEVLAAYRANPLRALKQYCHRGHPLFGKNLRIATWRGQEHRRCRQCRTDDWHRYKVQRAVSHINGLGDQ